MFSKDKVGVYHHGADHAKNANRHFKQVFCNNTKFKMYATSGCGNRRILGTPTELLQDESKRQAAGQNSGAIATPLNEYEFHTRRGTEFRPEQAKRVVALFE